MLFFAEDVILLISPEQTFQHVLDRFSVAYDQAGVKISTVKTEVLHLSRNPNLCP